MSEKHYPYIGGSFDRIVFDDDGSVWVPESENAKLFALLKHESEQTEKLRELVKKLVILAFARCADCDLLDASCALVPTQKCLLWNECESIARELGVEVGHE